MRRMSSLPGMRGIHRAGPPRRRPAFLRLCGPRRGRCPERPPAPASLTWNCSKTKPGLGADATNSSWPGVVPAIHAVELPQGKTKLRTSLSIVLRCHGSFASPAITEKRFVKVGARTSEAAAARYYGRGESRLRRFTSALQTSGSSVTPNNRDIRCVTIARVASL